MRIFIFVLFPILRVGGFPFPVPLIYLLLMKKITFYKDYFYPLFFSSLYLLAIITLNNYLNLKFTDVAYFVFPLIYLVLIHLFLRLKNTDKIIKVYFVVNLVIVSLTGILKYAPSILMIYYENYIIGNIVVENHYLNNIFNRGIGLIGHPAWLGIMMYGLGKFLSYKEGKYRYVVLSALALIMSGGRAALLILVFLELVTLLVNKQLNLFKRFKLMTSILVMVTGLFVSMYYFNDNFKFFVDITIQDIMIGNGFRSNSIAHRLDMFLVLSQQNLLSFLFGGGVFSNALNSIGNTAVDSEFILRSLQFGFVGYLLLFLPLAITLNRAKRRKDRLGYEMSLFLLLFAILGSLTTTVMTNMIFMIYISIMIAFIEKRNPQQEQTSR